MAIRSQTLPASSGPSAPADARDWRPTEAAQLLAVELKTWGTASGRVAYVRVEVLADGAALGADLTGGWIEKWGQNIGIPLTGRVEPGQVLRVHSTDEAAATAPIVTVLYDTVPRPEMPPAISQSPLSSRPIRARRHEATYSAQTAGGEGASRTVPADERWFVLTSRWRLRSAGDAGEGTAAASNLISRPVLRPGATAISVFATIARASSSAEGSHNGACVTDSAISAISAVAEPTDVVACSVPTSAAGNLLWWLLDYESEWSGVT